MIELSPSSSPGEVNGSGGSSVVIGVAGGLVDPLEGRLSVRDRGALDEPWLSLSCAVSRASSKAS